ncbi:DUF2252 family protein, partial [Arthrospira platensis SPKY1]|nr:DUF2252 family protein [Arthrospira platensis SPKY1]
RHRSFSKAVADETVQACLSQYRASMREHRDADVLDVWYSSISEQDVVRILGERPGGDAADAGLRDHADGAFAKARQRTSKRAAQRLTEVVDGRLRMREDPPVLSRKALPPDRQALATRFLESYKKSLRSDTHKLLDRFEVID